MSWRQILVVLFCVLSVVKTFAQQRQKVGVVLSGGGALGVAHIGVLKALEANEIPIDYIAGTSAGALIGGMYASGWSPDEIAAFMNTEDFRREVAGQIDPDFVYYFKKKDPDAGGFRLKFSIDSIFKTNIPTNIISPYAMDFTSMAQTAGPIAAAKYNYDSLFIPFRCVAADVDNKTEVVFSKGGLAEGIRASTTYPFYFKPIAVDGKVLFDGGLYNNFPTNVMYDVFFPDIIIGSNVSGRGGRMAAEDDLFSQIRSMLMTRTNYNPICDNMIMIEPPINVSIFDFSQITTSVDIGYAAAMQKMDTIKQVITARVSPAELAAKRAAFKAKQPPLIFENIIIEGVNKNQQDYIRRSLSTRRRIVTIDNLREDYFKLVSDDKLKKIYPRAVFNYERNVYDLHLDVKPDHDFLTQFGGCFSSKPINMGFISLEYKRMGQVGTSLYANAYFGKFYGSIQTKIRLDYPTIVPFYVEGDFTLNSYDYFTSRTSFFEEVRPSYLLQSNRSFHFLVATPQGNKAKFAGALTFANFRDTYYQNTVFTPTDTADRTFFNSVCASAMYERNTLNRKQYANEGSFLQVKAYYIFGQEENIPGSTASFTDVYQDFHSFVRLRAVYEGYKKINRRLRLGVYAEGVVSNQPFFRNYTSTLLQAPAFTPVPESQTLFLDGFRGLNFIGAGGRFIFSFLKRFDFRFEHYAFVPFRPLNENVNQVAIYGKPLTGIRYMGSAALVYETPIGPVSLSVNHYNAEPRPWSVIFTLGYIIFNRRPNQ